MSRTLFPVMHPTLYPYLNFNGNTAEAMRFYHSVLGGELNMQTFGEAKMSQGPQDENLIIHAVLKADAFQIMASDTDPKRQAEFGDNIHMSLQGEDLHRLTQIFNMLSHGGKIDMPLAKQFWGDTFGMLTDKYGVHWMVNVAAQPQK